MIYPVRLQLTFYAVPRIHDKMAIPITYTLYAPGSQLMQEVKGYYSLNGGDNWQPALPTTATVITNLATTSIYESDPTGVYFQEDIIITSQTSFTHTFPIYAPPAMVTDVDLWFDIEHPAVETLDFTLTAPNGLTFILTGVMGSNLDHLTLDDEASASITETVAPYRGRFRPLQPLADLDGSIVDGLWQIEMSNHSTNSLALVHGWGLTVTYPADSRTLVAPTEYKNSGASLPIAPTINTITSVLTVPLTRSLGPILDVDVWLNISHTYAADLEVSLISPAGTRVPLFHTIGGDGDNFINLILDDQTTTPITSLVPGQAVYSGLYQPMGTLTDLDGESAQGTWSLTVTDHKAGDSGSLESWGLLLRTEQELPMSFIGIPLRVGCLVKVIMLFSVWKLCLVE